MQTNELIALMQIVIWIGKTNDLNIIYYINITINHYFVPFFYVFRRSYCQIRDNIILTLVRYIHSPVI